MAFDQARKLHWGIPRRWLWASSACEARLKAIPKVIGDNTVCMQWGFKHDSQHHADEAVVNLNFWVSPDEANAAGVS